jgi:Protein of unknown function (DUF1501)
VSETISRRTMMKLAAAGVLGGGAVPWFQMLAARAQSQGVRHKSCILLWMAGGPAQSLTFDLKGGGPYRPIQTAVPGVQISEHLPKVAGQMRDMTLLRSMQTGEASHPGGTYLMHTGFRVRQGGVVHPSLGAIAAKELGRRDFDLPNYVAVGAGRSRQAGHLGPNYAPIVVGATQGGLPDLAPPDTMDAFDRRAHLVEELDTAFLADYTAPAVEAHQVTTQRAIRLMHTSLTQAFDVSREPEAARDAYGKSSFGDGCLLARRLVEAGVPFVEVSLGGWDTHSDARNRVRTLSNQLDPAMATLISDLRERGMLDNTLVVWMGEFGRGPSNGSQHFARAWTTVLAGGGLKHGQVVGNTGRSGGGVEDRPISSGDFMTTVCRALGIDPARDWVGRGNRPLPKVARDARPVAQLF